MSSEPSRPGDVVRIRAVRNDDRSDALRKIARACIAIARQQLDQAGTRGDSATASPPPDSTEKPEANHA
jgi:hypothetical protein